MSSHFNLILFTAATQEYANEVRDLIDPTGTIFKHVLSRRHCVNTAKQVAFSDQTLCKDLRILKGIDQASVLIVDNSSSTFANNLGQGIPIVPFEGDPSDEELKHLAEYLIDLAQHPDVVSKNREYFSLHSLRQFSDMASAYKHLCRIF